MSLVILLFPVFVFVAVRQDYHDWVSDNQYIIEATRSGIYDIFAAFRNNEL